MIVVSDTSPLNYLVLINAVDVLPKLFGEVYSPPQVIEELKRSETPQIVAQWVQSVPKWLKIVVPRNPINLSTRLDPGETNAIALAKEIRAQLVLIDQKKGRCVAKQEGLNAVGTITVLALASQKNLIELKSALEALGRTNFRISAALVESTLSADAARKGKAP